MLEIGSLVDGKYKVLSEVGRGGMSVVYMAINEKANKTWAVKEVRKDGVLDFETVKSSLIAETDILKKLSHRNLPSIVDIIDTEDSFIIIMDYIQGNSLKKILDEYGAQPQEYVIEWAKQLCDVLGYLHTRKPPIIYRDLKPSNIMLKPDGDITLIDFGTAREFKEKNLADTTWLGTVGYAAPEQFGGMGQTDARTDIYCLGATLYHLLTGMNPGEPPYGIRPIREINPALSSGLERIIIKCTQPNPDDRYQSAAELQYALSRFEEFDDSYRKKQKRKLSAFIVSSVLTLLCVVGGFVFARMADHFAEIQYSDLIVEAEKSSNYEEKVRLYTESISIPKMAGQKDAYLGLIHSFRNNDSVLSMYEAQQLEKIISNNRETLLKNPEIYTEICFEAGKLYWYYFDYGDGSDNLITKAKSAIPWFRDVLYYAPEGYENKGMALSYYNIGVFYRDITTSVTEGDDQGKYRQLFANLYELMNKEASNEKETDIVRLELLELSRSAIQQYATKFKKDGILETELITMIDQIESVVNGINTTTEVTDQKKETILDLLSDTREAVVTAYATRGGEEP